jgi:hypothetical protein
MTVSLKDIRLIEQTRYPTPTKLITSQPPVTPSAVVATGQQGLIRIQWASISGVEGYEIAIMTTPNLAAPDIDIETKMGEKGREFVYSTGNVAVTRYFSVRSFSGGFVSQWSAPVSGTSAVFGAAESAPPSPPVNPPSSDEEPPAGLRGA